MLFNSYIFIFAFLPITFISYFLLAKYRNGEAAITFLVLASLFFYGWWNPIYLLLMLLSIGVNYLIGESIVRYRAVHNIHKTKLLLTIGIVFNLGLLGYFKYANFIFENTNLLLGFNIPINEIVLPLAISFFTFQQVAYLIDAYKGITEEFKFSHYVLFVTFFPQLIAGPIVHHKEMLPQFMQLDNMQPRLDNIIIGANIFALGLFKKVVLADGVAQYASPVFNAAVAGEPMSFFVAWGGALAYTLQLYFDFSGYSDMAIGIARMFGIKLPLNFASPYKSLNIVEFWRRWHMTLSRFLRDYVYFGLGGNRKGNTRRYINLFATMLLGGLWHGAGWTFIFWGALHGCYLIINHAWHYISRKAKLGFLSTQAVWQAFCWLLTFISVVNAWVFFRATTFDSAVEILKGMYGFNGIAMPNAILARLGSLADTLLELGISSYIGGGSQFIFTYLWVIFLLIVVIFMPNTQQIMRSFGGYNHTLEQGTAAFDKGVFPKLLTFRFSAFWAVIMASALVIAVFGLTRVSEFLYFQF
ncbi:MAG: alginate O-acetyltransferase complex protein AlgI [Methyloprofundus sp.]|nr:MAG: alginate O-acetyltransferase complex protein AlgI [Methyloprofundus sp.]